VAAATDIHVYIDALVVLGTAGVAVPLLRRSGINPILGYLGAGALLGPLGLGSFGREFPLVQWITVSDAENVAGIADLGVVFLLFLIGLELSFHRLATMRRLVAGLGGTQVLLAGAVIAGATALAGAPAEASLVFGMNLALSSTAIVLEILSAQGRLASGVGRASFAILLAQDLAVIPILLFISILGVGARGSVMMSLATALVQAALAIAVIVVLGRMLLRPLFRLVASAHSSELFIAAVLFVIVAAGFVANRAGVSMALGAFVAGLLLAETEYVKAIETTVAPFKGLLLGIFFFTVGMHIDVRAFLHQPVWLPLCVLGLLAVKAAVLFGLARVFGFSMPAAAELGLLLAAGLGLVTSEAMTFALAVTATTMALNPLLAVAGRRIAATFAPDRTIDAALAIRPAELSKHAIVVGYGRVGKVVCALLKEHGIPYIAADFDPATVARDRREGHDVYYGDAVDPAFLETCGLMSAAGLIITIQAHEVIDDIVVQARALRPDLLIVARARDADHARHLYSIGATDAVPETIEASLQLSEATLVGLGVATGAAIASIHERRDTIRRVLQQAARAAGRRQSHAIKQKRGGPTR
jgi:CPA2 family monovalent cation:H+ antiporter-2